MKRGLLLAVILLLTVFPGQGAPAEEFFLRDGDRVVFYGDSITQDGGYAELVEFFVNTRFPTRNITFAYAGVGGDRVTGGGAGTIEERLARDVIALKPTVVTIMLGMNDGSYRSFDPEIFRTYADGYRKIVARLRDALSGVRLVLIKPSPFDDVTRAPQFDGGYDSVLRRYGQFVEEMARECGASVVDFGSALNQALRRVQSENPALARQIIPDRVHPGTAGHLILGAAMLRAWKAPSLVSRVEIDAQRLSVNSVQNVEVSELKKTEGKIGWKQRDLAFPLPLDFSDADLELAELGGADLKQLDQEVLCVPGLEEGRYELRIDGQNIATFSAREWADGVNLALLETPILSQHSGPTRWGTMERKELQTIQRSLRVSAAKDATLNQTATGLERLMSSLLEEQRQQLQPKPHDFELRSATK